MVVFAKEYLKTHPDINFFIFGHRHIMLDLMLSRTSRILIAGDWMQFFSYIVWDGENLYMDQFLEGTILSQHIRQRCLNTLDSTVEAP